MSPYYCIAHLFDEFSGLKQALVAVKSERNYYYFLKTLSSLSCIMEEYMHYQAMLVIYSHYSARKVQFIQLQMDQPLDIQELYQMHSI